MPPCGTIEATDAWEEKRKTGDVLAGNGRKPGGKSGLDGLQVACRVPAQQQDAATPLLGVQEVGGSNPLAPIP